MTVADTFCQLCGAEMREPKVVHVCRACHGTVQAGGAVNVRSTGEFKLTEIMQAAADYSPPPSSGEMPAVRCTWCGRDGDEVRKLLSQGNAHICNQCVALCADILHAELGDGWGK